MGRWVRENPQQKDQPLVLQENHYYPFGMSMGAELNRYTNQDAENKYKYNSKELTSDFDLNWSDYGARWYDGSVGRWTTVDPLADAPENVSFSPYAYVWNTPINAIDPDGRTGEWIDNGDGTYTAEEGDSAWSLGEKIGVPFEKAKEIMDIQGHGVYEGWDGEDKSDIHPGETVVNVKEAMAKLDAKVKIENQILEMVHKNLRKIQRHEKTIDSIDDANLEHNKLARGQYDGLGERNAGAAFWGVRRIIQNNKMRTIVEHKRDSLKRLNETLLKPILPVKGPEKKFLQ